ncbi:MAG: BspA family leucine-rich repeat surface protein, partial [Fibrobacterota bacterium]
MSLVRKCVLTTVLLMCSASAGFARDPIIATDATIDSIVTAEIEQLGNTADLTHIDVSGVTDMSYLFKGSGFNGDISRWDVSGVTDMSGMFWAAAFNQDISNWDVSGVTDMSLMFGADGMQRSVFNQDIGDWNVAQVTTMSRMFYNAEAFNQDISRWDVSRVNDMSYMFSQAKSFNQNIGHWNISGVTNIIDMVRDVAMTTENYDSLITGWAKRAQETEVQKGIRLSLNQYTPGTEEAETAWRYLEENYEWTIFREDEIVASNATIHAVVNTEIQRLGPRADLTHIDVSNVTDMNALFKGSGFNGDISRWDVSRVTDMSGMFE